MLMLDFILVVHLQPFCQQSVDICGSFQQLEISLLSEIHHVSDFELQAGG